MLSPFPGMDPYLEQPAFWSSFHSRLIVAIADAIEPQLSLNYYVEVETRTYQTYETDDGEDSLLVGIPDTIILSRNSNSVVTNQEVVENNSVATQSRPEQVAVPIPKEINERYLEIRDINSDAVITVIELLSPKNKRVGEGRTVYERKRRAILGSATHLVELDLLRAGQPMTILGMKSPSTYRILVSRSYQRPAAELYPVSLQQKLPSFPIPLKHNEPEPIVNLQEVLNGVYERARYNARIDYSQSVPPPALSPVEQKWLEDLLLNI
jgi:hypothetical protein